MSGPPRKPLLACVLALALAGCGGDGGESDGMLTPEQAAILEASVNQVENEASAGLCEEAAASAEDLVAEIDALPAQAGTDVKESLREMAQHLEGLSAEQCAGDEGVPEPSTADSSTTSTTSTSSETTTTDEETTGEESTTDTTEDEEPTSPEPGPDTSPPPDTPPGQEPGGQPGGGGGIGADFEEDGKR